MVDHCYYILANNEFVVGVYFDLKEAERVFRNISGNEIKGSEYKLLKQTFNDLYELDNKYFLDLYIEYLDIPHSYIRKIEMQKESLYKEKIEEIVNSYNNNFIDKKVEQIEEVSYVINGKRKFYLYR